MYLSISAGFYETKDGAEVFVPKGVARPDGHPDVKGVPSIFEKVDDNVAGKK